MPGKNVYKETILSLSKVEENQLLSFVKASLKASQYSAYQHDKKKFKLLEGVVRLDEQGRYIFTPSKAMQQLLDGAEYPQLLKAEESRFLQLLSLALKELQ